MTYRIPPEFWREFDPAATKVVNEFSHLSTVAKTLGTDTDRAYSLGAADGMRQLLRILVDMSQSCPSSTRLAAELDKSDDLRRG